MPRLTVSRKIVFRGRYIQKKVDKAKQDWLEFAGATTRKIAVNSLKRAPKRAKTKYGRENVETLYKSGKRKGQRRVIKFERGRVSAPGRPPFRRSDGFGLHTMSYAVVGDSVIVGSLGGTTSGTNRPAPAIHEFGLRASYRFKAKRLDSGRILRARTLNASFRARPYINPAGTKAIKSVRRRIRRSIK